VLIGDGEADPTLPVAIAAVSICDLIADHRGGGVEQRPRPSCRGLDRRVGLRTLSIVKTSSPDRRGSRRRSDGRERASRSETRPLPDRVQGSSDRAALVAESERVQRKTVG